MPLFKEIGNSLKPFPRPITSDPFKDRSLRQIALQVHLTNPSISFHRRIHKFCDQCGYCGRSDNLKDSHSKTCPVLSGGGRAGFLKVGEAPTYNSIYVTEVLEAKGCTCQMPPPKTIEQIVAERQQFLARLTQTGKVAGNSMERWDARTMAIAGFIEDGKPEKPSKAKKQK